jgi:hypothetical protein
MDRKLRRADGLKVGRPTPVELTVLIRRGLGPRLKIVIGRATLHLERKFGLTSLVRLCAMNVLKLLTLITEDSRLAGARFGMMASHGPTFQKKSNGLQNISCERYRRSDGWSNPDRPLEAAL